MEHNRIREIEIEKCNRFTVKAFSSLILFLLIVLILNILDIFIVKDYAMYAVTIVSAAIFLLMLFLYIYTEKHDISNMKYAYIASTLILIDIGTLYSFLTFHVTFLFIFPAILFDVYGNRRLIRYVTAGTLVVMILSHITSYSLGVNPEEPFTDMYRLLLFGLLPKMIIYASFMYVFYFKTAHNNEIIGRLYRYSRDMYLTQEETIRSFAEICESKSGQTGQHVKRVSRYVDILVRQIDELKKEREILMIASMMHDVGKLNIPGEILDKKGKLTPEEFAVIKGHTKMGYDLLKNSPGRTMELAAQIALNHHERWDGTGYNGLAGEQIDIYSRIVALADVFDALVSKRSYKEKWTIEEAYDEIVSQRGRQFDPMVVDLFIRRFDDFRQVLSELPD